MFFLGEAMNAEEALRLGIVNRVVAPASWNGTRELAERLRDAPPISIAAAKQAVYLSQTAELEEMLRYETEAQMRCFQSGRREGVELSWKNDSQGSRDDKIDFGFRVSSLGCFMNWRCLNSKTRNSKLETRNETLRT